MERKVDKLQSTSYAASLIAIYLGILWSGSFLCNMYGLGTPLLGVLGNILALISLWVLYITQVNYRRIVPGVGFGKLLLMGLKSCWFGSLLTAVTQYVYFSYLDNGRLFSGMMEMMEMPEYQEMMGGMVDGMDSAKMAEVLQEVTIPDLILNLLLLELFLSVPVTLVTATMARLTKVQHWTNDMDI